MVAEILRTEELVLLTRSDKKPKTLWEVDLRNDGVGGKDVRLIDERDGAGSASPSSLSVSCPCSCVGDGRAGGALLNDGSSSVSGKSSRCEVVCALMTAGSLGG